jgi:hypothetical protein
MLAHVPPARGLRFQNDAFTVDDLPGRRLDRLVALENDDCWIVLLKPAGLPWQRFFLDAGLGFWGEWNDADVADDLDGSDLVDLGSRFSVVGSTILGASCSPEPCIKLALSAGSLILEQVDPKDLGSTSSVRFLPLQP